MKIVACVKQTPSTTAVFRIEDGEVRWDDPGDKPNVLNPWDEYAVEEGIRLTEKYGGDVVALTMGDEGSKDALKTCLAMGCGEAILLSDSTFAGSDTLGTAQVLAAAIRRVDGASVAVFGKQAIDGDSGQTSVQVAQKLGWTPLTGVAAITNIDESSGTIAVERLLEDGRQTVTCNLPVVMSFVKEINEPRYPSFMGIRKANRATIAVWDAAELGLEADVGASGSKVDWSAVSELPARDAEVELIEGETVEEQARILVDRLFEEKVI